MFITGNNLAILYSIFESLRTVLPGAFPTISQTAGALLITAIWQGAIVAGCLALGMRLATRVSAGLRFTLWVAGFVAVVGLPFLPLALRTLTGPAAPSITALASAPRFSLDYRWSIAICLLWAAVSVYRIADLAAHTLRLRSLWLSATPVDSVFERARLRGRRTIEICTTTALDRPSVIGFFAPRILIPTWLLPQLTPGELDQIILHETEHLRRGDDWTNLLQKVSLILFPLNPVLLWMERQLCLEREMACDEAVIRVTNAPRAYAACLTTLAERGIEYRSRAGESLSLGAWQRRPELVHRVHRLLRRKAALGPWGTRGLAAGLTCGLIFGSIELARCPQLVSFVPDHTAETARQGHPAQRQGLAGAHAVLTSWRQPNPERSSPAYLVETRATLPVPPRHNAALQPVPSAAARKLASQPSPKLAESNAPRQILLKAEAPDQTGQSGWIVLTTWEEVAQAGDREAPPDSPASSAQSPEQPNASEPVAPQGQITVTRMVFRVIPASFVSPSPTAVRTRDGWLVIQM
jgi:beta-lactamase regulating signal transducer with metallopeptidase domain